MTRCFNRDGYPNKKRKPDCDTLSNEELDEQTTATFAIELTPQRRNP